MIKLDAIFSLIGLISLSVVGSVVGAWLSWAGSGQGFNWKGFFVLFIPALVSGLVFVGTVQLVAALTWQDYLSVFIAGAGLTSMVKHGADAYTKSKKKKSEAKT